MNKTKGILFIFMTVAILSSCSTKEGAPDKKHRVGSITTVETRLMDGDQFYTSGDFISEKWNWDGNEMYRIDYGGFRAYSENFFYDRRGRIAYTTIPAYGLKAEYCYDGRKLESIDVTRNDDKYMSFLFTHNDEDKISSIDVTSLLPSKKGIDNDIMNVITLALSRTMGAYGAKAIIGKVANDANKSNYSDSSFITNKFFLTWSGDNLIRVAKSDNSYVVNLNYDNKYNPYLQLIGYHNMIEAGFRYQIMSKNNITSVTEKNSPSISFTYQYKDDYPTHRVATYSYRTVNNDLDSVTITVNQSETITYID